MEIKNKKTFSLALDHWQLCELSINLKSSGFDGDLQINLCVTLTFLEDGDLQINLCVTLTFLEDGDLQINLCVTFTFLEECRRNPPPQDARIV